MKIKMNVYLDDVRSGPVSPDWVIVRGVDNAMILLQQGLVNDLSLDHDMGPNEATGYELLCWMEENNIWPSGNVSVHSANPVGAAKMHQAIDAHNNRLVECKFCGRYEDNIHSHLHRDSWVCSDCWDDRLKITE